MTGKGGEELSGVSAPHAGARVVAHGEHERMHGREVGGFDAARMWERVEERERAPRSRFFEVW